MTPLGLFKGERALVTDSASNAAIGKESFGIPDPDATRAQIAVDMADGQRHKR